MSHNDCTGVSEDYIAIEDDIIHEKLPGWKGALQGINDKVVLLERFALYICLYSMCLAAFSQWFLRTFFSVGYIWISDITKYAMLWSGFLGACLATSKLEHFRIDLVHILKNGRVKKILRVFSYIVAFIFCIVFSYATIKYIGVLIDCNEKSPFYGYKIWPVYLIVLYFYISSGFRFLMTALLKSL